jgi:ATP-binding cassette, subfamily C (CFTR/MRP), member 1
MHDNDNLQVLLTPFKPFAHGYLEATDTRQQSLCGNSEGWGPLSPHRYGLTPCFLDVWIAVVAVGGIIVGAGAVWYLLKKCTPQPVKKNWHFYVKLVG